MATSIVFLGQAITPAPGGACLEHALFNFLGLTPAPSGAYWETPQASSVGVFAWRVEGPASCTSPGRCGELPGGFDVARRRLKFGREEPMAQDARSKLRTGAKALR